jgi:hypothetical protein
VKNGIRVLAAALWWGSLSGLAFVVVPMLFRHMETPAAAGALAARLFTVQTWVGISCALLLLLSLNQKDAVAQEIRARAAIKFIVGGLLLALLVEFAVAPRIVGARAAGGNLKLWHAIGSAMYFIQWLCAGAALWQLARRHPQTNQPKIDQSQSTD